jgi:hypothetical protein
MCSFCNTIARERPPVLFNIVLPPGLFIWCRSRHLNAFGTGNGRQYSSTMYSLPACSTRCRSCRLNAPGYGLVLFHTFLPPDPFTRVARTNLRVTPLEEMEISCCVREVRKVEEKEWSCCDDDVLGYESVITFQLLKTKSFQKLKISHSPEIRSDFWSRPPPQSETWSPPPTPPISYKSPSSFVPPAPSPPSFIVHYHLSGCCLLRS